MGKTPCCVKNGLKKGPWTVEEDQILINYIQKNGHASWRALPELAGLLRCGKSCRLRWTNYLRPDIKRGSFTQEEERTIIQLHGILGNRWSAIASQLPGRTDNEIKNFWGTRLKKRLLKMGLDPSTHAPIAEVNPTSPQGSKALALTRHKAQWENARLEAEARLSRASLPMSSNSIAAYHTNNSTVETTTVSNHNPPADYFLKIWNSEAGKAFRKENHGDDPFLSSEIPHSSISSLCCVKTPEVLSCQPDITMGQTELGFPELLLDFADTDHNNNNTNSIQSELRTNFLQQPASPWPELLDEDYWINIAFS